MDDEHLLVDTDSLLADLGIDLEAAMRTPPFWPNPDQTHCLQCCVGMVLQYAKQRKPRDRNLMAFKWPVSLP